MPSTTIISIILGAPGLGETTMFDFIIIGPVYTPALAKKVTPENRRKRIDITLIKREGSGWDTGQLVRFLLSDQARFLTGQSICLDGGISTIAPSR